MPRIPGHIAFRDPGARAAVGMAFQGVMDTFGWNQRPELLIFDNVVVELKPLSDFDEDDDIDTHIWVCYEDFHSFRIRSLLFGRDRRGRVNGREVRFSAFRWVNVAE